MQDSDKSEWAEVDEIPNADGPRGHLPIIELPGGEVGIIEGAEKLFQPMARSGQYFLRGGRIMMLGLKDDGTKILSPLGPDELRSELEKFARLVVARAGKNGTRVLKATICSGDIAKALLASSAARECLPHVRGLINCPFLFENSGKLEIAVSGYNPGPRIYVTSDSAIPEVSLETAISRILALFVDFRFKTPADKARAVASLLSPALKLSGLLRGRLPADVAEADESQKGKGYRQSFVAAFYNEELCAVAKRVGGVGSVDETFSEMLVAGRPFIQLDNFREKFDSQYVESFMTAAGLFPCRIPRKGSFDVRPEDYFIFLSSNGVETTRDFANRSNIIRMLKQREGFKFKLFEGAELLIHVKANQPFYLGCVFSIIRAWHAAGKPKTEETRHDFREWAQILDWIVQNYFKLGPLMDGHREAQERVSNPDMVFLRALAIAYDRVEHLGEPQTAMQIGDFCDSEGISIPGMRSFANLDQAMRRVGSVMANIFKNRETVEVEGYQITRAEGKKKREDGAGYSPTRHYVFEKPGSVNPVKPTTALENLLLCDPPEGNRFQKQSVPVGKPETASL